MVPRQDKSAKAIRVAATCNSSEKEVARHLHSALSPQPNDLIILFAASKYNTPAICRFLKEKDPACQVMAASTAGEIGPDGCTKDSVSAICLSGDIFSCTIELLELNRSIDEIRYLSKELKRKHCEKHPHANNKNSFAFTLIDGLCGNEEAFSKAINDELDGIPMFGGSAGDDGLFKQTTVALDNNSSHNGVLLLLATTDKPFHVFKTQNFVYGAEDLVVTAADPTHRIVKEINGVTALEEYAHAINMKPEDITSNTIVDNPVVIAIGGDDYVRSIKHINDDGSLTFFCAIDVGMVFRIGKKVDAIEGLLGETYKISKLLQGCEAGIICNCILRDVEMRHSNSLAEFSSIMAKLNAVGFNTYGEQFSGIHINQTLTGIIFGE